MLIQRGFLAAAAMVGFVGTVFAANWAIVRYGAVPVGCGLVAPAGVYFAGLSFTLRDLWFALVWRDRLLGAVQSGPHQPTLPLVVA